MYEDTGRRDLDIYGITKHVGQMLVKDAIINCRTLILPSVIGKGFKGIWIMRIAEAMAKNDPVKIYNSKGLFNNTVDSDDVVTFIEFLINTEMYESDEFLLSTSDYMKMKNMVEKLKHIMNSKSDTKKKCKNYEKSSFCD